MGFDKHPSTVTALCRMWQVFIIFISLYSEESPCRGVGPARGGPEHEQDAPAATSRRRQGQVKRSQTILRHYCIVRLSSSRCN